MKSNHISTAPDSKNLVIVHHNSHGNYLHGSIVGRPEAERNEDRAKDIKYEQNNFNLRFHSPRDK